MSSSSGFRKIADLVGEMKNPNGVVERLGLPEHPTLHSGLHPWDPLYRQVVYRADAHSLHVMELPDLQLQREQQLLALPEQAALIAPTAAPVTEISITQAGMGVSAITEADDVNAAHPHMPPTLYELRRQIACKFFSIVLKAWRGEGRHPLYCMPLQAGCVHTLRHKLSVSAPSASTSHGRMWWEDIGYVAYPAVDLEEAKDEALGEQLLGKSSHVWFSVCEEDGSAG